MTLGSVIDQLKYGELRSVAVKDDNVAIVSYINLALVALYGRFNLKTSEEIIDLSDNVTEYTLPFDTMTIDSVWKEDGTEIPIGDPSSIMSVFKVSYNTIQVTNPVTGTSIAVVYVADPTFLVFDDTDAGTIEASLLLDVPIPLQLLEPLLHYVGYRAHGSINGDVKAENNTHYMRYEASCKRIESSGVVTKEIPRASVSQASIPGEE